MSRARPEEPSRAAPTVRGVIVGAQRRHFDVVLEDGSAISCVLKGRSLPIACGDTVDVERVAGGGAITGLAPRRNLLWRSDAFKEKLLAANVDQVLGVVAPDIGLDEELIQRWMIAAEAAGCRFAVIANKRDLPSHPALMARLAPVAALGYPVITASARDDPAPLRALTAGRASALVGQSGMGKSTIINALCPDANARTATVSAALASGRHTTTATRLYRLGARFEDGWIVDSPGMKAFGLAHVGREALEQAFVELRPLLGHCRFRDCRHRDEPGCAVRAAVADGRVQPFRLALLLRMQDESTRP